MFERRVEIFLLRFFSSSCGLPVVFVSSTFDNRQFTVDIPRPVPIDHNRVSIGPTVSINAAYLVNRLSSLLRRVVDFHCQCEMDTCSRLLNRSRTIPVARHYDAQKKYCVWPVRRRVQCALTGFRLTYL